MNIHIVTPVFPPERGSARRVGELALWLSRHGHSVTVVTACPSYPKGIVFNGYRNRLIQKEIWSGTVTVYRVYSYISPERTRGVTRVLNYASLFLFSLLGLMSGRKPDVIYTVSPPYFLGLSAWLAGVFRGARLAFEVQDIWPDAPIALGYVKSPLIIRWLQNLERYIYRKSSLVITISDVMRERILQRVNPASKVALVHNWVDMAAPVGDRGVDPRCKLGLEGRFIALFAGNIGKAQGLDVLLDAAAILIGEPNIHFVILGDGIERQRLMDRVSQLHLNNVHFVDAVPESEVPAYLETADVLVSTLGRAKHREAAIPSKLQVYMASGKPIIVSADGAANHLVGVAGCGLAAPGQDAEALADAILRMSQMLPGARAALGMAGRSYARENFRLEDQCGKIESLLLDVVQPVKHAN